MKYLVLVFLLVLCVPAASFAGPSPEGYILMARMDGNGRRPAPGTVVITGKGGKVTDVRQKPGEGDRNRDRDRERDHDRKGSGPGPGDRQN